MARISKRYTDDFAAKKKNVENWQQYFWDNIQRFHAMTRSVAKTQLTQIDRSILKAQQKPDIEFNMQEASVTRALAECALYEPDPAVRAAPGMLVEQFTPQLLQTMKVIEAHLRAIFSDSMNDSLPYQVFSDLFYGGFSVIRVFREWASSMSFEQNIHIERAFSPTLCFFDPLARKSHKGDGRFAGSQYAMSAQEFTDVYGSKNIGGMKFIRSQSAVGDLNWSYKSQSEDIVIVADYAEKRWKEEKIVKLSNGQSMTDKKYQKFLEEWNAKETLELPPQPTGRTRKADISTIHNFVICETGILDHEETDLEYFETVFVDGNSKMIFENDQESQFTKPLCLHSQGVQKLMTFTGQSLANEIENRVQSKYMSPIAAINPDYDEAWKNPQKADMLLYNHVDPQNPSTPLPPPQIINQPPIPMELLNTIRLCEEMSNMILGTFSPGSDLKRADESGIAVARLSMLSNQSIMPYVIGYINSVNHIGKMIIDLIPKTYQSPRSLPVMSAEGQREYIAINSPSGISMDYDPTFLEVVIDARTSFALQKEISLNAVTRLMSASEGFAAFINQQGLMTLIDNLDIRGLEQLKVAAQQYVEQQQQQQQQAQEQQQAQQQQQEQMQALSAQMAQNKAQFEIQNDQLRLMAAKLELVGKEKEISAPTANEVKVMQIKSDEQIKAGQLALNEKIADDNFVQIIANVQNDKLANQLQTEKVDAENTRTAVESAVRIAEHLKGK